MRRLQEIGLRLTSGPRWPVWRRRASWQSSTAEPVRCLFALERSGKPSKKIDRVSKLSRGWTDSSEVAMAYQSRPSSKPSPLIAHALWIDHCRSLSVSSPKPSDTSAAVIASGWSWCTKDGRVSAAHSAPTHAPLRKHSRRTCLLAKTSSLASFNSSSLSIASSSALLIPMRSLSELSTT